MDLQLPIVIVDELAESIVKSTGSLDLASGEIRGVQYEGYDVKTQGFPADSEDYEFTCGILSNEGKDVEFRIEVDVLNGRYSVNPTELLEIKVRAAKLFAGIEGKALLANSAAPAPRARPAAPRPAGGRRKMH